MSTDSRGGHARNTASWRALLPVVGALMLLTSIVTIVVSGASTSSARIAATTDTGGFLSAGTVVVNRATDSTALFFDADGLYPGAVVTGCVAIRYEGSAPAAIRLTATPDGGTGLDRFIEIELVERLSGACPDADSPAGDDDDGTRTLYDGRLRSFWQSHSAFSNGLEVAPRMQTGDVIAVEATVTVVDDNGAAGLDTELSFSFESRPT